LAALLAGLTVTAGTVVVYIDRMAPIQQAYLGMYTRSSIAADLRWKVDENTAARELLREALYGGRFVSELLRPPLVLGGVLLVVFVLVAVPVDRRRADERRIGRRIKGAEKTSARAFSKGADGIAFRQVSGPTVVIPRSLETSHILLAGDTGTGKSRLIREVLGTVERRGETAIVYDPALEYAPEFYRPERGDVILNPVDARCPYWTPGDEVLSDVEALTLATALIHEEETGAGQFFTTNSRLLLAFLLTFKPTADQLVRWLTHADVLDKMVIGTPHQNTLAVGMKGAGGQRAAILGTFVKVAYAMQLCPTQADCVGRWSAVEWAKQRKGWLFITSTPETRATLTRLHTLWLDSLILRLMGHPHRQQTWLVLDELSTLNKLPQLHTAVTEGRKSGLAMVIGFQGRAQMESRYGKDAETMLSQPATKIFLRASDAKAAEWASKTIGDVENERVSQSRQDGWAKTGTRAYRLERHVEPLVLPSEIGGLANLTGYIKVGNRVTEIRFPYVDRPRLQPALVQRPPVPPRRAAADLPPLLTSQL
jgi:type IV secretory pathway TraG/TraD family ATPase VirD4